MPAPSEVTLLAALMQAGLLWLNWPNPICVVSPRTEKLGVHKLHCWFANMVLELQAKSGAPGEFTHGRPFSRCGQTDSEIHNCCPRINKPISFLKTVETTGYPMFYCAIFSVPAHPACQNMLILTTSSTSCFEHLSRGLSSCMGPSQRLPGTECVVPILVLPSSDMLLMVVTI